MTRAKIGGKQIGWLDPLDFILAFRPHFGLLTRHDIYFIGQAGLLVTCRPVRHTAHW